MTPTRSVLVLLLPSLVLLVAAACGKASGPAAEAPAVDRAAFNLAAQRLDLPLIWVADDDGDGRPQPGEVAGLAFFDAAPRWVEDGRFTPAFDAAAAAIAAEIGRPGGDAAVLAPEEAERRRLVRLELDQARPSLVRADLADLSAAERTFLGHLWTAGAAIDRLYARQLGIDVLEPLLPADDAASRRLFRRNWGPQCVAPRTQNEAVCSALPGGPKPRVDVYPAAMTAADGFCAAFQARPDAERLSGPFTAVRADASGELVAVPYSRVYGEEMGAVAAALRAAAAALPAGEEGPLRAYLAAAAVAFETDDWLPADEAWAAMNARNSRWYLRIAPDETYWEPCSLKAGFHLTLARIDLASLAWQDRLAPLRADMEAAIAGIAGPPYAAREVDFRLPDFLALIANFGDDRAPLGGTAGQSLPNWGPVANEGRGRTVAMTNIGSDPDGRRTRREQLASLVDAATLAALSADAPREESALLDTILHEAAHNLGPAHEYRVGGKTDAEIFGGALATTFEELKAQTFGQWLVEFLRARGVITAEEAREDYGATFSWCMRHISRGMTTGDGLPRPYSQLAAIQVGFLLDDGALAFDPDAAAANGRDRGAFHLDFDRLPAAWEKLAREVGAIKARGDAARAEALRSRYVEGDRVPFAVIQERVLRQPQATFVYAAP